MLYKQNHVLRSAAGNMVNTLPGVGASMVTANGIDRAGVNTQTKSGFAFLPDCAFKQTDEIIENAEEEKHSRRKNDAAFKQQHSFTGEQIKNGVYFHSSTTPNIHILV